MSTPKRVESFFTRPVMPVIEPLKKGASLDDEREKLREIYKALGQPVHGRTDRIDLYEPIVLQHVCYKHGCPLCKNWCSDADSHGCTQCSTGPCGGPQCTRCFEAWGTTDPSKVDPKRGQATTAVIRRNHLSPDVAFWIHGAAFYMKKMDSQLVRQDG